MSKRSIEDVLGAIKVPVRSVSICLDADLQAEHDELTEQLDRLRREQSPTAKMVGPSPEARQVADRIRDIETQMNESRQVFKFRGLTRAKRLSLEAKYPPPDPNPDRLRWDIDKGAPELLAESAVEPTMTVSQAKALIGSLAEGQADALVNTAWMATTGSTQVPFSVRASELTSGNGSK